MIPQKCKDDEGLLWTIIGQQIREPGGEIIKFQDFSRGTVVKVLPSIKGGVGSIPGQGTKIPHAASGTKYLNK